LARSLLLKDDGLYHFDAGPVLPAWIDWNGHMNVAYYVLAFDQAVDAEFDAMGLDAETRGTTGQTMFAAEMHITWKRELSEGDPIAITWQILEFDEKRLHSFFRMNHATEGFLASTSEWMQLCVDLNARRTVPWQPKVLAKLKALYEPQRGLVRPAEVGRVIAVPGRVPAG
jgi:acyl-CoA thioester hydrolase